MQTAFATALLNPHAPIPPGIVTPSGAPLQRFSVYRNNVMHGLVGVLAAGFPATEQIVGADFFRAMAQAYVAAEPPRTPVLLHYGHSFPQFIAAFAPAAELTYLADVAQLEFLRRQAYNAADADRLTGEDLSRLDPAALGDSVFQLHPACALLRSPHPVATIWAMNSGLEPLHELAEWPPEDVLIFRAGTGLEQAVLVHRLSPGTATFLAALRDGATIASAAETAFADAPGFDLAAALALLFGTGLVATSGKSPS